MRDIVDEVERWLERGKKVAVATVIATERSAPRDPGAALAVTEEMDMAGSVSAGCVEAAVAEEALDVLRTGRPKRLSYGIADEEAFAVGLSCGGVVHLFVAPMRRDEVVAALAREIRAGVAVALATEVAGPQAGTRMAIGPDGVIGTLGDPDLDKAVEADARVILKSGRAAVRAYRVRGEAPRDAEVFLEPFVSPPRMYVFGATEHAVATARIGTFLGHRVTVCDARAALTTGQRFPEADEVVVRWPDEFLTRAPVDERTVICVLTHDPKFDLPLLRVALQTPAAYIGVLGSRRTHEERCRKLAEVGVPAGDLARIRAPIGLDIGARTPEEVAVAIAAEIVALRAGRPGGFLAASPAEAALR